MPIVSVFKKHPVLFCFNNTPIFILKLQVMRIRYVSISFLLVLVVINGCNTPTTPAATSHVFSIEKDSIPILTLVRSMYQWKFTEKGGEDFPVIENQVTHQYDQLDTARFGARIKELEATGYFSTGFMQNFSQLGNRLNTELRNKQLSWPVGELAPFGNGANYWCDCQDYPDNFWKTLTIQHIVPTDNHINLDVMIAEGSIYRLQVIREKDEWKIEAMEGLLTDAFFPAKQSH